MKNTNNVPRLRFPKFTDDWEQRKLGDVSESFSGGTPSVGNKRYYDGSIPFIRSAEINSESTELFLTEEGLTNSSARMVSKGDILYALYGATSGEVGRSRINGAINQAILAILPHDGYDSEFLMQWLRKSKQGITDVYLQGGQGNLSGAIVKALEVDFPSVIEQRQIGNYFQSFDNLITLHQRKCDKLEEYKKAMLQKIFSQELRFKREDGTDYSEWSNKRFVNAFTPLNNNTFSRDMLSENGTVLNIHYGDILVRFGEVCDIQTMDIPKVNTDIDTSRFDELQNGDIVLADTAEDETVGKAIEIYHIGTSKVVSGLHTMACRPTDKYAPKYMGYYINSPTYHNQLLPFMQGIKVTSIGRRNIADTVVYYPYDIEEQQKIADFLSALDEAISYAKQELNKWKELKKGLLQQMFV